MAQRVVYANTFLKRLKGLLFKKQIDNEFGLFIKPCKQIHTFGMHFNIDVLFLSKDYEVLEIIQDMKPGRVSRNIKDSAYVLELASGVISDRIQVGEKIKLIDERREFMMEGNGDINKLRISNAESVQQIKKVLWGGYDIKDVDHMMEMVADEKNKIIKGYEEQLEELKTSLSMVVRERDNSVAEKNEMKVRYDELLEQNRNLIQENEELSAKNEELSIKIEILDEDLVHAQKIELPVKEEIQIEDQNECINQLDLDQIKQVKLELEVENEQLIKNNSELMHKMERLNEKVMELTQQLTDERTENKKEGLRLQGELHKKDVAFRLKTNNILENLNIIIKEVESINTY